ncbi:MAG: GNAT family N-acetyltransferase [Archangiaceae bacterium]|nr:GNAT family N-acetyltransferase [Archangiaceae bacterium]
MKAPFELQTPRLLLRQLRESDLDAHTEMMGDPEVVRFLGDGKPLDRAQSWRTLAGILGHWQLRGYGFWALEEKGTGAFVGRAGLWRPEGWPMLEVGWTLARAHWGKGYATEAGRAALEVAFEAGATEVCSLIMPDNVRSIRVAVGLGETLLGPVRVTTFDCLMYSTKRLPNATRAE